ncbi:uncharacterized protein J4E84_006895 [Alternaria hordeiaustralica]|uniref:uncharacterized protein n=1 Tax=Alternaria hordeiaustralica TaxID=1187925 RepID=UPI0020C43AFF|nr:uncharacterized protein J4E84_006895 [Alternaria hordeiaustralica]KAI4682993.1 hypothetical protein J4E84_006895 [Alternaria hordeiaustralica]
MATQAYSTCALPEGLRYYLLRGSVMVPLVPVDQLPFQLQGIPRQLTHRQISDGAWKLCSETNEIPSALLIQAPTSSSFSPRSITTTQSRYLAPDHHVRAEPQTLPVSDTRTPRLSHTLPAIVNTAEPPRPTPTATISRPSLLTDTFASIYQKDAQRLGYRVPHPSGIEPDPSKKEYCTHWIKTGECDWTAIGCKFKHEMPCIEKLRELGFVRGIPKWWREKSAIGPRPPTWMQRRLAANEDADQGGVIEEARVFPDPSTFRTRRSEERDLLGDEVQQPRGIFKRNESPGQTTSGRLTPPPLPVQEPIRRASQVSDLLIDLDDNPAPPPSPESSRASEASSGFSEMQIPSSRPSASPPSTPSIGCSNLSPIENKTPHKPVVTKKQNEDSITRRHSQLSWASDTEDDTPAPTKPYPKPHRPAQQRRKPAPRGDSRRAATTSTTPTPTKHSGLAASKHATNDHAVNNSASHGKNANRKVHGKHVEDVGVPELHAKIEQLRREAHQKERVRKGAVMAAPAAGRRTAV